MVLPIERFAEIGGIDFHLQFLCNPRRAVRVGSFGGLIFPNLPLRLKPVSTCLAIAAASLLVEFIGSLGNLRCHIDRFLGHGVKNAPFDYHDLQGVVHDKA